MAAFAAIIMQGCIGTGGSSAPPPNNVVVVAKDSRAVVTWDTVPGVEYWLFRANGSGVTPENCSSMPLCLSDLNVTSPATVASLVNDLPYSFSINGRTDGGPGGAGSLAVSGTPRKAGATWNAPVTAVIPGTTVLRGVAYGASGTKFVAAGEGGALYSGVVNTNAAATGLTEIVWTALTNPLSATNFNAVNYDVARAKFVAVGAGGKVIANVPSVDAVWTEHTSGTNEHLHAVANNGAGVSIAAGDHGKIIYNADGGALWTVATAVPSAATAISLYGAAYGNSTLAQNVFVAVGASRTLLYSTDSGVNWLAGTCSCTGTPDLKAVTYGGLNASGNSIFVAVGAGGTVLTSENGINWTQLTTTGILSTSNLTSITYSTGRRFVAVADDGNVYYSDYYNTGTTTGNGAVTWTQVTPSPVSASPLHAVATGGLFDYLTVGAGGVNLYAD